MKVYALQQIDEFCRTETLGVYGTRRRAEEESDLVIEANKGSASTYRYYIDEYELNKGVNDHD